MNDKPEHCSIDPSEPYEISISDITCQHCVSRVEKVLDGMEGVTKGQVNLVEKSAIVVGGDPDSVVHAIKEQGYDAKLVNKTRPVDTYTLGLADLNDRDSVIQIMDKCPDVSEIDFESPQLIIKTQLHPAEILILLQQHQINARFIESTEESDKKQSFETAKDIKSSWQRAILAGVIGISLMIAMKGGWLPQLSSESSAQGLLSVQFLWFMIGIICLFTMWFSGRNYYVTAFKQAKYKSANMDTLVAMGTGAAWLSSMIIVINPAFIPGGGHLYFDAAVFILAFLNMGHALELKAKRTTARAITSLIELAPKTAKILYDYNGTSDEIELPVSLIKPGDKIKVRPGERIPIDGVVIEGSSSVDESMLTGESVAISKAVGNRVTGGSINQSGQFTYKVDTLAADTTLAHIIEMVRQAQMSKPQIGRLVDKIASIFVPAVISIAVITFLLWYFLGPTPNLAYALTAGIAVLVIACPCALGLATPIAIMMGTGKAAQLNILIKNSDALQTASTLTHLVVDKTGTLTLGKPALTQITAIHADENTVLQWAASLEQHSEHPLAKPVVDAAVTRDIKLLNVTEFEAVQGRGVKGQINDKILYLGNKRFMQENEIACEAIRDTDKTTVWLATEHQIIAELNLEDPIREDSRQAVESLQKQGIEVVMCTGDNQNTANTVAKALNIHSVYAQLLPQEKLNVISQLQSQGHIVGMVGDGINDAPALAKANTGFAIGSGTDVAIENADITLAGNSLKNVSTAISISNATILNIKQNLFGAFIYNVIGIPLAAGLFYPITGWLLAPAFASAAMAMSSVTVVVNANRLRFFKG